MLPKVDTQVRLNRISTVEQTGDWKVIVDGIAPSVNHQYRKTKEGGFHLDKKVQVFRQLVSIQAARLRHVPKTRLLKIELIFSSPRWVTQKLLVRRADVDNLIKGTLDALVQLGIPDENIWEISAKKLAAQHHEATYIGIVDMGDIVPYHLK